MNSGKHKIKTIRGIKEYTFLGCPLTNNNTAWCYRICNPDSTGNGHCGRIAPHTLKSITQLSIEAHNKKKQLEKLQAQLINN